MSKFSKFFSTVLNMRDQFKGASLSDRTMKNLGGDIPLSADNMILDDLPILRQRSKILYNNVGICKSIVETICDFESNYKITSNIKNPEDKDIREFINSKFEEFSNNITFDNKSFDKFIKLYKKTLVLNGEVFIKVYYENRDTSDFNTFFQILAPERIFTPADKRNMKDNVIDGIQKDEYGRPIGFYYLKFQLNPYVESNVTPWGRSLNASTNSIKVSYNSSDFEYISFRTEDGELNALHIYNEDFPEQTRGIPYLSPVIKEINNYYTYNETEWYRRRAASSIGLVINSNQPVEDANNFKIDINQFLDSSGACIDTTSYCGCDSTTGYSSSGDSTGLDIYEHLSYEIFKKSLLDRQQTLSPGSIMYLKPGETATTVNLQGPDAGVYESFQLNTLMNIAGALKLPFFLFYSDWAKLNFSSAKAGLNRYKVTLNDNQQFDNESLIKPIYKLFIDELVNQYPELLEYFKIKELYSYEFFGPVVPDVDVQKDATANINLLNNKLITRTEYYASRGQKFEDQMRLIASEEEYMKSLGLDVNPIEKPVITETNTTIDENIQTDKKE